MIAIISRRRLLFLSGALSVITDGPSIIADLEDVADLICISTPKVFLEGVMKSGGHFLYRGDEIDDGDTTSKNEFGRIRNPLPDLLLPGTYEEKDALAYFECLEKQLSEKQQDMMSSMLLKKNNVPRLTTVARPSNGHIGTPNVKDASMWGDAVSVWPLGSHFSFAWPDDRNEFYPPLRNHNDYDCFDKNIQVDHGLTIALNGGREVLFTSWFELGDSVTKLTNDSWVSAFVAVPAGLDKPLKRILEQKHYGLSRKYV